MPCARSANWSLSEEDRKVFCELHTPEDEDDDEDENDEEIKPLEAGTGILGIEPQVMSVPVPININSLP